MMRKMSPEDVAQVQRGMAARPDSIETLKTINVPTLLVTGDEDIMTGVNEAEADAPAYREQPAARDPKGRTLLAVGAARSKPRRLISSSFWIVSLKTAFRRRKLAVPARIEDAMKNSFRGLCHPRVLSFAATAQTRRAPRRTFSASITFRSTPPLRTA